MTGLADDTGTSTAVNSYSHHGQPSTGNEGRFQYTGQVWIEEIGLYYYKARFYDPQIKRFLNPDPIGYADGMNIYAYVHGDPINGTDPTGLTECDPDEDCVVATETRTRPNSNAFWWTGRSGTEVADHLFDQHTFSFQGGTGGGGGGMEQEVGVPNCTPFSEGDFPEFADIPKNRPETTFNLGFNGPEVIGPSRSFEGIVRYIARSQNVNGRFSTGSTIFRNENGYFASLSQGISHATGLPRQAGLGSDGLFGRAEAISSVVSERRNRPSFADSVGRKFVGVSQRAGRGEAPTIRLQTCIKGN